MSATTDFLMQQIKPHCDVFWDAHHNLYDFSTNEGCGQYTEDLVERLRILGFEKVGHLKKYGSATQYNGHANDAFLYREADPDLYRAVDVIFAAEAKPPYTPSNPAPNKNFGIDIPRYEDKDWMAEPGNSEPVPNTVPWVAYNEQGFQRLKNMLAHDYGRRPQGADFDVSVWAGRYFHNCYMGPEGIPLGEDGALHRIKPELCAALGIPMDNYYGE